MKRFIKTETSAEVFYFRTFANCLHYFKVLDEMKLREKDSEAQKIYNRFYKKFDYHNFTDVTFDFGKTSRFNFTDY